MNPITIVAMKFFEACETGKGWKGCKQYCNPEATFTAQAEPVAEISSLQQYADWIMPQCRGARKANFPCAI